MDRRADATIGRAVELGYNYLDTAPSYGDSEARLGRVLPPYRSRVILATKISPDDWSVRGVRRSVEQSLRHLKTDTIDVIQFHGGAFYRGEERAILESGALDAVQLMRTEGKVRYIGFTTEAPSGGAQRLLESGAFDTMQIQYSIFYQCAHDLEWDQGLIPMAAEAGVGVITMRTMTSGRLRRLAAVVLPEISTSRLHEIALQYVLSNNSVCIALVGMTSPELVEINNAISEDLAGRVDTRGFHDPVVT